MLDTEDVFFQSDPFQYLEEFVSAGNEVIGVFQQGGFRTIGECALTSKVIRDCLGFSALKSLESSNIVNAGSIVGTKDSVLQLLEYFVSVYSGEKFAELSGHKFPLCEQPSSDQAILNAIVHLNLIPELNIITHKEQEDDKPFVIHLQYSKLSKVEFSRVYSTKGFLVPIVHQYDSNHGLWLRCIQVYAPFAAIESSLDKWNTTESCKKYNLVEGFDMLPNTCDLKIIRAIAVSSCCDFCDNSIGSSSCHAFAFFEGNCYLKHCETEFQLSRSILRYEESKLATRVSGGYFAYVSRKHPMHRLRRYRGDDVE
jgi:hypothetical protein